MPVGRLLVEGLLDVEIFTKVFGGVNVVRGGSKNSLRPQTRNDRAEKRMAFLSFYPELQEIRKQLFV